MFINEKEKILFFIPPKVGSRTIRGTLGTYGFQYLYETYPTSLNLPAEYHCNINHYTTQILEGLPEFPWHDYFKICFVRNPYSRLYSCFIERIDEGAIPEGTDFNEFLVANRLNLLDECHINHFIPLHHFTHLNNKKIADFIGTIETFDSDWKSLQEKYPFLPNYTRHHTRSVDGNYFDKYTALSIEIANEFYAKDFEIFGYKMLAPNDFPQTLTSLKIQPIKKPQYIAPEKLTKTQKKILQVFRIYQKRNNLSNKSNMIQLLDRIQTHYPTWDLILEIQSFLDHIKN